jgi:hypothetical protein
MLEMKGAEMNPNSDEKLRIFALAKSGKRHSFQIPVKEGLDLLGESHAILSKEGFTTEELKDLILSPTELEELPSVVAGTSRVRALSVKALESDSSYPPIPKPRSKDEFPPQKSSEVIVNTNNIDLFVYCWGNKGFYHGAYMPLFYPSIKGPVYTTYPLFPLAKIAYKRYWLNTGSHTLIGPQNFSKAFTTTVGMSNTNSTTLSAELGVEVKGLSAKLSKSTTTSITISEEKSITETYSIEVEKRKICVYTLWQLIEVFVLVDVDDKPIGWKGVWGYPPFMGIPAVFPENQFSHNCIIKVSDTVWFDA